MKKGTQLTEAQKTAQKTALQVFDSREAALAIREQIAPLNLKLMSITSPEGKVSWTYSGIQDTALLRCAKAAGWKASAEGKAPTRDRVGAMLAQLSDEDRSILIAAYVPASAPASEAPEEELSAKEVEQGDGTSVEALLPETVQPEQPKSRRGKKS